MKKFLYCILYLLVTPVLAGQYPVVVPNNLKPLPYPSNDANVTIHTYVTDVGPGTEQVPPAGYTVTLLQRGGDGVNGTQTEKPISGAGSVTSDGKRTLGDLVMEAYNKTSDGFKNGVITINYTAPQYLCQQWGATNTSAWTNSWNIIATGPCTNNPPSTQSCQFVTQDIILDHGTLALAEGSVAKAQVSIQCTSATALNFILISGDKYIDLGEGKAEITVNNQPLGNTINAPNGQSTIEVEDKLIGAFSEGAHTGSSVLVMQFY